MNEVELSNAEIVWDYMLLGQELEPVDYLIVLGSRDERVARATRQTL